MIVITNPIAIENEINTIHALFECGLELLHVRKPDFQEMK
jgi:thiamine-phosphate pyrophosphorylase